jgi:hypothetical protein
MANSGFSFTVAAIVLIISPDAKARVKSSAIQKAAQEAGKGRRERTNHEDLKDLKETTAFAFHSSGRDFFEVFEVFVVRFSCHCLNDRSSFIGISLGTAR